MIVGLEETLAQKDERTNTGIFAFNYSFRARMTSFGRDLDW
jgi:hypothetical protein